MPDQVVEELDLAGRELSTAAILFHGAVAERRGLSTTEEKAVDVLLRAGPLTHAELGERIGLRPPSVTNLIDRLEQKGFAHRRPHPEDGRRILIAADAEFAFAAMAPLFADFMGRLHELYADYDDDQLRLIAEFIRRAARVQEAATRRLLESD